MNVEDVVDTEWDETVGSTEAQPGVVIDCDEALSGHKYQRSFFECILLSIGVLVLVGFALVALVSAGNAIYNYRHPHIVHVSDGFITVPAIDPPHLEWDTPDGPIKLYGPDNWMVNCIRIDEKHKVLRGDFECKRCRDLYQSKRTPSRIVNTTSGTVNYSGPGHYHQTDKGWVKD